MHFAGAHASSILYDDVGKKREFLPPASLEARRHGEEKESNLRVSVSPMTEGNGW
jgi:hypothetical protein